MRREAALGRQGGWIQSRDKVKGIARELAGAQAEDDGLYPFQLFKNRLFSAVANAGRVETLPMLSRHLRR